MFVKASSVLQNGNWFWPPPRSKELVLIQRKFHQVLARQDAIIWIHSITGKYGCITSWEVIPAKLPIFIWLKLLQFANIIPKYVFISRLAVKNIVATRKRKAN